MKPGTLTRLRREKELQWALKLSATINKDFERMKKIQQLKRAQRTAFYSPQIQQNGAK
jgi:hypothetical protein